MFTTKVHNAIKSAQFGKQWAKNDTKEQTTKKK